MFRFYIICQFSVKHLVQKTAYLASSRVFTIQDTAVLEAIEFLVSFYLASKHFYVDQLLGRQPLSPHEASSLERGDEGSAEASFLHTVLYHQASLGCEFSVLEYTLFILQLRQILVTSSHGSIALDKDKCAEQLLRICSELDNQRSFNYRLSGAVLHDRCIVSETGLEQQVSQQAYSNVGTDGWY